jgi:hypothetical protein
MSMRRLCAAREHASRPGNQDQRAAQTFGLVVGKVGERAYAHRVRELVAGEPGLEPAVHARCWPSAI